MIYRNDIVNEAREWIDTPYHHLASLKGVGCDCIGLLRGVWEKLKGELPIQPPVYAQQWYLHQSYSQLIEVLTQTYDFTKGSGFQPGSVLCFSIGGRPAGHAGIMVDNGRFIHSYMSSKKVVEVSLDSSWRDRVVMILDYPGTDNGK